MDTNSVTIDIPANSQGEISCIANASYFQRVTLEWNGTSVVFSGTGEDVPMQSSSGTPAVGIPLSKTATQIIATFEYSGSGGAGPYKPATVLPPVVSTDGIMTIVTVTSEDGADTDNNDSYLTVAYINGAT